MQVFLNTADVMEIRRFSGLGLIRGVTTNPTILARHERGAREVLGEICNAFDGPVSVQPVADHADDIARVGKDLYSISDRIVIKVPATIAGFEAASRLEKEGIPCNVTLCFTFGQALWAVSLGVTFLSVFSGRLAARGQDAEHILRATMKLIEESGSATKLIAASISEVSHMESAAKCGVHISTVAPDLLDKLLDSPLTVEGLAGFESDWAEAQKHF